MRIVSGTARGRKLAQLTGKDIRPTPDRVREALFSMLVSRLGPLAGKRVLDLYSGTGAMAIEALSRGAGTACLIDQGRESEGVIASNLDKCGFGSQARFIRGQLPEALNRLSGEAPFDLIFLDPPYDKGLIPPCLETIEQLGLLATGGVLCAETSDREALPSPPPTLEHIENRKYGITVLHLFSRKV